MKISSHILDPHEQLLHSTPSVAMVPLIVVPSSGLPIRSHLAIFSTGTCQNRDGGFFLTENLALCVTIRGKKLIFYSRYFYSSICYRRSMMLNKGPNKLAFSLLKGLLKQYITPEGVDVVICVFIIECGLMCLPCMS